ncbi:hypothetical protein [Nocardia fluminea]|uniref:hypothetical protein n=1 Tax=Nocardia fluminea TaxID=134984 RepID=UPI003D0D5EA4
MNQPVVETPVMGLPRDEMMRIALAARTMASMLREIRERRGRAAWDDTTNASRKRGVAQKQMIGRFNNADLEEWNRLAPEAIRSELHPESGMTIRVGPLSNGRYGVQAGWSEHHAETVAGSKDMADRIADWLRTNASHEAVDVMHLSTEEMHNGNRTTSNARSRAARNQRADFDAARKWLHTTDPERAQDWERSYAAADSASSREQDARSLIGEWTKATGGRKRTQLEKAHEWVAQNRPDWYADWRQQYDYADTRDGKRLDEAELIRYWVSERAADSDPAQGHTEGEGEQRRPQPLADRLRGKVPDRVLDDARWETAEQQFATLTGEGADPDQLAAAVAAIDFDSGKVRAPSGFAAWVMRDAAKNGRARSTSSEDDARRDVAQEWLDTADGASPFDRARAATLVGEIDEKFDAALAAKFPGILDGDEATPDPDAAEAASGTEENTAQERDEENVIFVVDQDGNVVEVPFVAAEPAAEQPTEDIAAAAATTVAPEAEGAAAAAQAVMTPPTKDKETKRRHTHRRTPPPASEPTRTRTRGHGH